MKLLAVFALMAFVAVCVCKPSIDNDDDELIDKREAVEFYKRLFHPFSTRCEEQKRETKEVYEEKCESIVPFQR